MFNDMEKISWANLKQAHGSSEHVPAAIKGLISDDEKEQEASYWKLDNHIVLQGDLYQAAFYVIPFLLEILAANIRNGRSYVYDLLFEIANGFAPEEVPCDYDGVTLTLTEGCKRAVAGGLNLYLEEISDNNSICRENALDLIVSLEEHVGSAVSRLIELKGKEINREFQAKLEEAIVEING
jgi:hypothetical protein